MTSMLLAVLLAVPNYTVKKQMNPRQVRAKAYQIVQMLKRQDPRVIRAVLYYMGWVPKFEYKKNDCKKNKDPVLDMLMDEAGIPKGTK